MTNYNNLPVEVKDGSNGAVQATTNTETIKEAVKNEATPVEKLGAFVSGLGSVKAEAQSCNKQAWIVGYDWNGVLSRGNTCYAESFRNSFLYLTGGALLNFAIVGTACILATVATSGIGGFVCYILFSLMAVKTVNLAWAGDEWAKKARSCGGWATVEIGYFISYKSVSC
jgi:hypothetical protein